MYCHAISVLQVPFALVIWKSVCWHFFPY